MPTSPPAITDLQFAAIDFESAGTGRGRNDVPVQIAISLWSPETGPGEHLCSFLSTDQEITWAAQQVHGITPEDLVDAPSLLSLWPEIKRLLSGRIIVAHGHGTEKRFLRAFPGHPFGPWVDTLLLARAAWPGLVSYSLGDLCRELGLVSALDETHPGRRWHDALYDASASAYLLAHLVASLDLADKPLDLLLHPDLAPWRAKRRP